MPSFANILVTKVIGFPSRCRCKQCSERCVCLGEVALATLARLLRTHEQLIFHLNCNWAVGLYFVLLPQIQGDSCVASCVRLDINGFSNYKKPSTLAYCLSRPQYGVQKLTVKRIRKSRK